jgi:hypothetical protein
MTVDLRTISAHALVLLAIGAGVLGMGTAFDGAMHASFMEVNRGLLFLIPGLWWAGRALGWSMIAARRLPGGGPGARGDRSPSQHEDGRYAKHRR